MASSLPSAHSTPENSAVAIRHLAEHGYDSTTAGDLADAVGMSRSTFFRRFGNKDDVIFSDHDHALMQLSEALEATQLAPSDALVEATCDVLRLLIRNPEAARLRFELMHHTPSLRDRELVITHRYERVFARYMQQHLPADTPTWVATAIAASIVAIHNTTLRDWLRGRVDDAPQRLARDLRQLVSVYQPWLSPDESGERRRVVVAVYDATASPDSVLASISETFKH